MGLSLGIGIGVTMSQPPRPSLSHQQRKEIKRLANSSLGFSCQGPVGMFLDLWMVCEVLAKKLIMYHKELNELPTRWSYEQISAASMHFSLEHDPQKIKEIFKGGHGRRGANTPRQLRNGFLHSTSSADINEIEERINELSTFMEHWRNKLTEI